MPEMPFTFDIALPGGVPSHYDSHLVRRLSSMRGLYADQQCYEALLAREDVPLYEVYGQARPEVPGDLCHGTSIVHPGQVGQEYFMTRGHYHAVLEAAEIYFCLQGQGVMVMETPEGEWSVPELRPGKVLFVPPCWAHRSVNTSKREDLVTFYVTPGNAGHDYGTIARGGFRKLVVERAGQPLIIDNPCWRLADAGTWRQGKT
jgi:glucose-6-phosphate isomerase, archaeal